MYCDCPCFLLALGIDKFVVYLALATRGFMLFCDVDILQCITDSNCVLVFLSNFWISVVSERGGDYDYLG